MAFATILYNDVNQETFKGIKLSYKYNKEEKEIIFSSFGCFMLDHYDYMKWLSIQDDQFYQENYYITWSSSYDHFFMDGELYEEKYFDIETGDFIDWRKAYEDKNYDLYHDVCNDKYPRCIVRTDMEFNNFLEVKDYYNKKKEELIKGI